MKPIALTAFAEVHLVRWLMHRKHRNISVIIFQRCGGLLLIQLYITSATRLAFLPDGKSDISLGEGIILRPAAAIASLLQF